MDLTNTINALKQETIRCVGLYTSRAKVGDVQSTKNQKQLLIALHIYIRILEYFNGMSLEEMGKIGVDEFKVLNCVESAISCTKVYKPFYYG